MEKLTGQQIIELLMQSNLTVEDFAYNQLTFLQGDLAKLEEIRTRLSKTATGHWWESEEYKTAQSLAEDKAKKFINPQIGSWEEVDQYGGEGQGDSWWAIKYFKDHDVYLKVSGYYQSHYGTDFSDWASAVREVKPQQKTITVYE